MDKVTGAAVDARNIRIKEHFKDDLAGSPFVPVLFEIEKMDVLGDKKIRSKQMDAEPITLELRGGERLQVGKYSKPSSFNRGTDYGIAWKILGQDPHGSMEGDQRLIQHPWVMLEHLHNMTPIPLEKTTLGYGEAEEILRWMAMFNPEDMTTEGLEFKIENYPKMMALKALGKLPLTPTLAEETNDTGFKDKLGKLEQYRKSLTDVPETKERYLTMLAEVNRLRESRTQGVTSFDDLNRLYNEDYLRETFGDGYKAWVHDIYLFAEVQGLDMTPWSLESLKGMMPNPTTNEPLTDEDLLKIQNFISDNGIGFSIGESARGVEMVTNPRIAQMISGLPDSDE